MTSRIETEHGDITAALDVISIVPEIDQAALPVNAIIHQSWESHLLLEMNSGLEVCAEVIGCFDELSITTPFDELVGTLERSFETEIYSHPLPVFGSSVSAIDFGEVVVGESAAHELTIDNPGELQLEASTVIDGTGEFRVFPDAVIAPPGTVDGLIVLFEPETAGPQSADFVLSTNDPARPEVRIHLTGQAMAPPVAAEDTGATEDSGEAEDTGELSDQDTGETEETGLTDEATQDSEVAEGDLKGCGCASGPAPAGPLAWCFGLGWMLSRRRREG
jgi:hypothetical protein